MKTLPLLLLFPALAFGQALHEFSNGDVADAEKINQNFNYVLENASGGCTATQQDNSVIIECADGTTGVLAGAGTVVAYPEGVLGESYPVDTIEVGEGMLVDANGVILGPVNTVAGKAITPVKYGDQECLLTWERLFDLPYTLKKDGDLFYESDDCSGLALTTALPPWCVWQDQTGWMAPSASLRSNVAYQSRRASDGTCTVSNGLLSDAAIPSGLGMPPELLEIAYPVSITTKQ